MCKGIDKKRKLLMAAFFISMCMTRLSACSNKPVDYSLGDTEQIDFGEGNVGGLAQFADAKSWEETFHVEKSDGSSIEIRIDAQPVVPEADGMAVVEIYRNSLDAAYKEQLVKTFFEDSEVLASEEMDAMGLADSYAPVTDYNAVTYKGEKEGTTYILNCFTDIEWLAADNSVTGRIPYNIYDDFETLTSMEETHYSILYAVDGNVYPKEIHSGALYRPLFPSVDDNEPNLCTLTEEEARKRAEIFLADIGISGFVFQDCEEAYWSEYEITNEVTSENSSEMAFESLQTVKDGYVFIYGLEWENWISNDPLKISRIKISVNESGIINLIMINPIEIISAVEHVGLLPLETVQKIMRSELKDNADVHFQHTQNKMLNYRNMKLGYFCMQDPAREGYFSYIPAWNLSGNGDYPGTDVVVNAVDGTVYTNWKMGWFQK